MQRKIFKTGHSAAVTLSRSMLNGLNLKVGDAVKIEIKNDKSEIVIRPGKREDQLPLDLKIRPHLKGK